MAKNDIAVVDQGKQIALKEISDRFGVVETVKALQKMMTEVTKNDVTPDSVNAACNCVQGINNTIKTSIHAARFLSGMNNGDE